MAARVVVEVAPLLRGGAAEIEKVRLLKAARICWDVAWFDDLLIGVPC
jgi:hypothetical protein